MEEWLQNTNPFLAVEALRNNDIPCMVINATDDIVCDIFNFYENERLLLKSINNCLFFITPWGSHCCSFGWNGKSVWNNMIADFLESCNDIFPPP